MSKSNETMNKGWAILLAVLTALPVLLYGFSALIEGMLPESVAEPPPIFALLMGLMCLIPVVVVSAVVFYLVYLFTRPNLPLEKKLLWALILVVGNVYAMPVFWVLHVWKQGQPTPVSLPTRFSLFVYAPLSLALLLPQIVLLRMAVTTTFLWGLSPGGTITASDAARGWAWVAGPFLGAAILFGIGQLCYNWVNLPGSRQMAWLGLWGTYLLASQPTIWFLLVFLVGMVPTDAPADTWKELGVAAIIAALVAQPFVVGWLYTVSRMARRFESAPA